MSTERKVSLLFLLALFRSIIVAADGANETVAVANETVAVALSEPLIDYDHNVQPIVVPISDHATGWGLTWVGAGDGNVPSGAIVGGRTNNGEILYIGRVFYRDDLIPGKIHPSHRRLYISYRGREHKFANYEVLVEVRR